VSWNFLHGKEGRNYTFIYYSRSRGQPYQSRDPSLSDSSPSYESNCTHSKRLRRRQQKLPSYNKNVVIIYILSVHKTQKIIRFKYLITEEGRRASGARERVVDQKFPLDKLLPLNAVNSCGKTDQNEAYRREHPFTRVIKLA